MTDDAFARMLEGEDRQLRWFCHKLTRDREAAEDLAQDTLIKAWRFRKSYSTTCSFSAWLLRIAERLFFTLRVSAEYVSRVTGHRLRQTVSYYELIPDSLEGACFAEILPNPKCDYDELDRAIDANRDLDLMEKTLYGHRSLDIFRAMRKLGPDFTYEELGQLLGIGKPRSGIHRMREQLKAAGVAA